MFAAIAIGRKANEDIRGVAWMPIKRIRVLKLKQSASHHADEAMGAGELSWPPRSATAPLWPQRSLALTRLRRHGRACPGHPRLRHIKRIKTWMPGSAAKFTQSA